MIKKIIFTIILFLLIIINVSATTIDKEIVKENYNRFSNPKTGVVGLEKTIIPITLIGGLLIIHSNIQNKKEKNNLNFIKNYIEKDGNIKKRIFIDQILVFLFSFIKFLFDKIFSFVLLILLLPLLIIISIMIKLDSKGPILYKQVRTGKYGKNFNIYKFRTMIVDNDVSKLDVSDKYTKFGDFLRKTSLDELPQLFLIMTGKMSFIGPRPWIPEYYDKMNDIERHKYDVLPGLTGLAQVNGRNNINVFEKINYDLLYIKNYSLIQDIKIVFLTIKTLFDKTGVNAGKNTIKKELNDLSKKR